MFEQRQQMMKDYMDKQDNPQALQEMMTKAAEMQKTAMLQMKKASQQELSSSDTPSTTSDTPQITVIPSQTDPPGIHQTVMTQQQPHAQRTSPDA